MAVISEVCALCKLLYNPLRLEMLMRIYDARDGMNVGQLVDEMSVYDVKQPCVSQYLKQMEAVRVIVRRRAGKYANYFADSSDAPPNVRIALRAIIRGMRGNPNRDLVPLFGALMNPFRAAVVFAMSKEGRMDGATICAKFNHQAKYLKRDLKAAVDAGILAMEDGDSPGYRFIPPTDETNAQLISLCH